MKQNIRVRRYEEPNSYAASVEPEDGAWVLFVSKDPAATPELVVRVGTVDEQDAYAPVGSEEHRVALEHGPLVG